MIMIIVCTPFDKLLIQWYQQTKIYQQHPILFFYLSIYHIYILLISKTFIKKKIIPLALNLSSHSLLSTPPPNPPIGFSLMNNHRFFFKTHLTNIPSSLHITVHCPSCYHQWNCLFSTTGLKQKFNTIQKCKNEFSNSILNLSFAIFRWIWRQFSSVSIYELEFSMLTIL